jgi:predicted amidohydrolase YtcJ
MDADFVILDRYILHPNGMPASEAKVMATFTAGTVHPV